MTGCTIQWWYKSPVICLVNSANEVLTSVMTHKRWCAINHVQDQVCEGWVNILSLNSGLLIICFALSLHVQTWTQHGAGTGHSVTTLHPRCSQVNASPPQRANCSVSHIFFQYQQINWNGAVVNLSYTSLLILPRSITSSLSPQSGQRLHPPSPRLCHWPRQHSYSSNC